MFKVVHFLNCLVVISTITAIHLDALPEHEILSSLAKYRHHAKHGHSSNGLHSSHGRHSSHGSHSSQGRHSSRRRHYPHELETLFGEENKEEKTVCQSEECKLIARIIKDNINKSVNPCDDFYEYACGKFAENNPIPAGENSWSFIQMMQRNLDVQMKEILTEDSNPNDLLTIKLGKKYFRTCTDRKSRERIGLEPLISTIARIGGWPIIMEPEEWDETAHTWQRVDDYYAALTGHNAFYDLHSHFSQETNESVLTLSLPRIPTGGRRLREEDNVEESHEECDEEGKTENEDESNGEDEGKSLNDDDDESKSKDSQEPGSKDDDSAELENSKENHNATEDYIVMISKIAMALAETRGFHISEHRIAADINDMTIFHRELIKIGDKHYSYEDNEMTLREFQEFYDNSSSTTENTKINFIAKILGTLDNANIKADEDLKVNVRSSTFYPAIGDLLAETPTRVIINYIHWLYISHFMDATNEKMSILHNTLKSYDPPSKETISDKEWMQKCISEVGVMDIMAYAFVKKYFPDEIKMTVEEMISYVQKEVEREITESEWLNDDIRELATEKVRSMKKLVGYPSWYSNTTIMKNYYKGLVIGPSYFENRMSFSRYLNWKNLRTLKANPSDQNIDDFDVTPLMLNALYAPFENTMIVTAADFQNPFFSLSRPAIINYGIVGAIMGHEVNHGFDDDGRLYEINGKKMKWLDTMATAYNGRVECFVDQYNSLVKEEILKQTKDRPSYGNRTRNENIADTMGLEASLGAYRIFEKEKKTKSVEVLPGLENLSSEQLFFLSYANTFCEVISPERLKSYKGDVHSTGRLRVLGPTSNSETFAKSFNCPVGSPMNPEKKCNIWK